MEGLSVGIGINRYGRDAHFTRGFDNPTGNLAAIGDKDFCDLLHEAFL
jgi:hypothetical protein